MPIHGLDPKFKPWADWIYDVARRNDLHPQVTSDYRSMAQQARLHREWVTGMRRLPAAPPGCSMHNYGLARDMTAKDLEWLGMVWTAYGGQWGGLGDPVHFGTRGRLCT